MYVCMYVCMGAERCLHTCDMQSIVVVSSSYSMLLMILLGFTPGHVMSSISFGLLLSKRVTLNRAVFYIGEWGTTLLVGQVFLFCGGKEERYHPTAIIRILYFMHAFCILCHSGSRSACRCHHWLSHCKVY